MLRAVLASALRGIGGLARFVTSTLAPVLLWRPVLVTIPYSHYVEIARWSLEASREPFWELKIPCGPHMLFVPPWRCLFRGGLSSSGSVPGGSSTDHVPVFRRAMGVPALCTREGTCVSESWQVLERAGFAVEDAFKKVLDDELGPDVRLLFYHYVFQVDGLYRRVQACSSWSPAMMLFDLMEAVVGTSELQKALGSNDMARVDKAEADMRAMFAKVSQTLEGAPYLGAGSGAREFGGADLAFSALVGLLVCAPQYSAGVVPVPRLEEWPERFQRLSRDLASCRAGCHALKCYARHRL